MKFSINMVLIGDLWSRARPTAAPPAQWQSGSEDAEGPEAAPWTGDRRRWPEDTGQATAEGSDLQGMDLSRSGMIPLDGALGYGFMVEYVQR